LARRGIIVAKGNPAHTREQAMKFRNSILCALGAATLLAVPASASSSRPHPDGALPTDPDTTVRANGVVFQSAALNNTLAESSNLQIGKTITLHCPTKAGCVVGMRFLAEARATTNTQFFIWVKVDGKPADPTAQFETSAPTNALAEGTFDGNLTVHRGLIRSSISSLPSTL
jgi:hypothetical protein